MPSVTCEEMRRVVGGFLQQRDREAQQFWDLITALRGPDTPSERADMSSSARHAAYLARRARKYVTTEVIRGMAFYGISGGQARVRHDTHTILLPSSARWDHFDKHVYSAAMIVGATVQYESVTPEREEEEPDHAPF